MTVLTEQVFTGKWRSFKLFRRQGDIVLHSESRYMEFLFGQNRMLTILVHEGSGVKKLVHTDSWAVCFDNRKHLLTIQSPKLQYEIITVNHTVLVLLDLTSVEKIFFAREEQWKEYLRANKHFVM